MAKVKSQGNVSAYKAKPKVKRKGIHAKSQSSHLKQSKNYRKSSVGQG